MYDDQGCAVTGISEGELFEPESIGLQPSMTSTVCWRGYRAIVTLLDSRLVLQSLRVKLPEMHRKGMGAIRGPIAGGTVPMPAGESMVFIHFYENLQLPLHDNGGILLAADLMSNLYVHMAFHPAWKYERVIAFTFTDDVLHSVEDKSQQMKEFRGACTPKGDLLAQVKPTVEEVHKFVERAFDRHYRGLNA